MHGDTRSHPRIDGSCRPKLGDGARHEGALLGSFCHAGTFLPEEKEAVAWQVCGFQWHAAGGIVDRYDDEAVLARPLQQVVDVGVVHEVLVAVGDHRAAAVPALAPHDVHYGCGEGVCSSHDGTDVGVVFEVFDGDVQRVAFGVEVFDDGFAPPVAIVVDYVASVAFGQQDRVVAWVIGQWLPRVFFSPRPEPNGAGVPLCWAN